MSTKSEPQSKLWTLGANDVSVKFHRLEQMSHLVGVSTGWGRGRRRGQACVWEGHRGILCTFCSIYRESKMDLKDKK